MVTAVQETQTSVHLQVVVHAPIERAFQTFTNEFDRFKPREHNFARRGHRQNGVRAAGRAAM